MFSYLHEQIQMLISGAIQTNLTTDKDSSGIQTNLTTGKVRRIQRLQTLRCDVG